jgi:hypothetical protein
MLGYVRFAHAHIKNTDRFLLLHSAFKRTSFILPTAEIQILICICVLKYNVNTKCREICVEITERRSA